jgi:hypothetical protein
MLTDGVIQLDEFGPGDIDAHLANEDEEMARRFGWWPNRSTAHDVRAAFDRWAESWASGGAIRAFAVRDVANATLVGSCELRLEDDQVARASYSVGPHARRRGFASRALQLATQWAFDCLVVARVELTSSPITPHLRASRGAAAFSGKACFGAASAAATPGATRCSTHGWRLIAASSSGRAAVERRRAPPSAGWINAPVASVEITCASAIAVARRLRGTAS